MPPRRPAGSRRAPVQKKSGTPPMVIMLAILIPLIGILVVLLVNRNNDGQAQDNQKVEQQYDPNKEIAELRKEFTKLREGHRKVMSQNRESAKFKSNVEKLKRKWTQWMAKYDEVCKPLKDENGRWKPGYEDYSDIRGKAQELKLDAIKVGNL